MRIRHQLPLRITLVLCVVLITTAWNLVRAWTSIAWSAPLSGYLGQPGPWYVGLSGGFFALLGSGLLWGFWRRASWAPWALLIGAWIYVLWLWADRLAFQALERANWPFVAVISAVLVGWVTAVALDRRNQAYFGKEANDRKFEDHPST